MARLLYKISRTGKKTSEQALGNVPFSVWVHIFSTSSLPGWWRLIWKGVVLMRRSWAFRIPFLIESPVTSRVREQQVVLPSITLPFFSASAF